MASTNRSLLAVLVMLGGALAPAVAQPAEKDVIKQLQVKADLSDQDKAALQTWTEQRVQAIASDDPATAAVGVRELRKAYEQGSPTFKAALAEVYARLARGAYKRAGREAAARLITLVTVFKQPDAPALLVEAIADKRVPVRAAAAVGLRRLRQELATGEAATFAQVQQALATAGAKESSAVVLKTIYEALDYTKAGALPDAQANATAVLNLLVGRGQQYAGGKVSAEAADTPGLELAGKLLDRYNDDQKKRLLEASARMLAYGVSRYVDDLYQVDDKKSGPVRVALRNRFEQFIIAAENLLTVLARPASPPAVSKTMQESVADEKRINVANAMKQWSKLLADQFGIQVEVKTDSAEKQP